MPDRTEYKAFLLMPPAIKGNQLRISSCHRVCNLRIDRSVRLCNVSNKSQGERIIVTPHKNQFRVTLDR